MRHSWQHSEETWKALPPASRLSSLATTLLIVSMISGCSEQEPISTSYGERAGAGVTSVNGTYVLSEMFKRAGFRVSTSRFLGQAIHTADVVVWCPDTFTLPSDQVSQFFDDWLTAESSRTLVYIGRDYDGGIDYWERISTAGPPQDAVPIRDMLAERKTEMEMIRKALPQKSECRWFTQQRVDPPFMAGSIGGLWSEATTEVSVPVYSSLVPHKGDEADTSSNLLTVNQHVLAMRLRRPQWLGGQLIATTSGAWLLNLPLVEPGHRQLAQQLVTACTSDSGTHKKKVVFLESARNEPVQPTGSNRPYWLEAFTVWPFNSILIHATLVGMIVCLAAFPIFGRARDWGSGEPSDFGQHIAAIGRLTAAKRDVNTAQQLRQAYWTIVKHKPLSDLPPLEQTQHFSPQANLEFSSHEPTEPSE